MKASRTHTWQSYLPFAVLMAGAYLLYMQAFSGIWLMDDLPVVVNNPDIRSFSNFLENYYPGRPLRELTYLIDYRFFGLQPAGYFVQQIFWHGLCSWLVFLLAKQLQAPISVAWLSALLFLSHPVQVEVVANISHRKDSLALAFCLLSFLVYLRGRIAVSKHGRWWLLSSLLLWGVALTAKQNALALPLVAAAYELYKLPSNYRRPALQLSLMSAGLGLFGWLVYLVNSPSFIVEIGPALRKLGYISSVSVEKYFLTVFKAWAHMASKLFYPVDLSMEYTFSVPAQWSDPWVVCGIASAVLAVAVFFWSNRRSALVYVGLAWLLAFWLPTSGLPGHVSYFAADRYWYSPIVGFLLLATYCLWKFLRGNQQAFILLAIVLLSVLSWHNWQQQLIWGDKSRFSEHMLRVNPGSLEALIGLGHVAMERGEYDKAVEFLHKAFQRSPQDGRIIHNLGYIAYKKGDYDTALNYFQRALALDPSLVDVYNNLGSLYDDLGQPERAIKILEQVLVINPHFEKAYMNLGMVYEKMGQLKTAEDLHRRALLERPDYGEAHYNLGNTLYHIGRKREAMASFLMAIQLLPENVDALYNYAVVASELGHRDLSLATLAKVRAIDPQLAAQLEKELL